MLRHTSVGVTVLLKFVAARPAAQYLPAGDFERIDDIEATTWHDLDRLIGWSFADLRF